MADPGSRFSDAEIAAAERLDSAIDDVLAGRAGASSATDALVVAAAIRTDPPTTLGTRVERSHERLLQRRWRPFRYVAALLGYLFFSQGLGNIVWGNWVADGIGEDFSPHITREGGFALMAVGIAVAAGALVRRMAPVSVAAGVPLAVAFGISGIGEIGVFAAGAVLHISQGVVGIVLGIVYWRIRSPGIRRDSSAGSDEEGT